MGAKTGIEWTDATWNPIRGCTRVSEGCRNCYAESVALRFSGAGLPYEGLAVLKNGHASWTGKIQFVEEHLLDPLKWKSVMEHEPGCLRGFDNHNRYCGCEGRPRRIFVNSMSDLFHENVTDEMRDRIFAVMALCPQHTFQVLTKRPERMKRYMIEACTEEGGLRIGKAAAALFHGTSLRDRNLTMAEHAAVSNQFEWKELKHVWLGVSVENQAAADERIPLLLQTPAAVRFLSCEPLLGPVDLCKVPRPDDAYFRQRGEAGVIGSKDEPDDYAYWQKRLLHWVICGGESGPHARPMHPDWARSLRDRCQAAGVPFFFKQWGEWIEGDAGSGPPHRVVTTDRQRPPIDSVNCVLALDGHSPRSEREMRSGVKYRWVTRIGKKAAGALLDGREWKQFPEAR